MRSIRSETVVETVISKSRFRCFLAPARDPAAAAELLARVKRLHPDATHHCHAYVCGPEGGIYRAADDGEPSGSAGTPMLEAIRKSGYTDVAVVVVRYFGGIKLGVGGLARAYGGAVRAAMANAIPTEAVRYDVCRVTVPAADQGIVAHALRIAATVMDVEYGDTVVFRYRVKAAEAAALAERLARVTSHEIHAETVSSAIEYE